MITNCMYDSMGESNITAYVNNLFTLFKLASFNTHCLSLIFTWTALGDVDLYNWIILVTKVNAAAGGTTSPARLYHQCNQSPFELIGTTVTSLSANLQYKTIAARDHLCQIALQWKISHYRLCQITLKRKLSCKSNEWCKFSSCIKAKSHKRNRVKEDLPLLLCCQYF
jgi:hypothetical protein